MHTSSADGYEKTTDYVQHSFEQAISHDEIVTKGPIAYFDRLPQVAHELLDAQKRDLFRVLDETTQESGNVFDAEGKPFYPELLLEAIERIPIEFDDEGNPKLPTIIVNPAQMERFKEKLTEWESDPVLRDRYVAIMRKKKEEWLDRENNRKLVD